MKSEQTRRRIMTMKSVSIEEDDVSEISEEDDVSAISEEDDVSEISEEDDVPEISEEDYVVGSLKRLLDNKSKGLK